MEEVRIPNQATYTPLSLLEVAAVAPLATRLVLGATLPGRMMQAVAMGAYLGSAAQDWIQRAGVRKIRFMEVFGADVSHLDELPLDARRSEVGRLVERLNDGYTARRIPRREVAVEVDRHLTDYIAGITGQRVTTSTEVRNFSLIQIIFPFALGACDMVSGDVTILRDTGVLEPHVIAHEFCHRKGYFKELEAQAIAYLALTASGEPVLIQSALFERLHRDLVVLADDEPDVFRQLVEGSGLRAELCRPLLALRAERGAVERSVGSVMRTLYDERMKLTGQNGISDYDLGFTNFLYTVETGRRRGTPEAGRIW